MRQDVLGNLDDWGQVLEQLTEWSRQHQVEQHQDAIIRLLRYHGNWRLREAALEAITAIRRPAPELIDEVCTIMMNETLYYQVRVLAAEALSSLLDRAADAPADSPRPQPKVREQIHALLNSPQPPVLHQAARRMLPKVE